MKVEILQLYQRGIPGHESLQLHVLAQTDLVYYAVLGTRYTSEKSLAHIPRNTYWFYSTPVKAGDFVILFSGVGKDTASQQKDGRTTHFRYWGLPTPIWGDAQSCAVVLELSTWIATPYAVS